MNNSPEIPASDTASAASTASPASTAPSASTAGSEGKLPLLTIFVAGLAVFAVSLDGTALYVAFGDIAASFSDVSRSQLSWVLTAYTLTYAALLVPAGRLSDIVGHKKTFLVGSAVFTTASLCCALAPSVSILIAVRAVQAIGGAGLAPASLALVLRATPREKVSQAVAVWGAIGALAAAIGPTLGAVLIEYAGWRWVFVVNVPIGLFTILIGHRTLNETAGNKGPMPTATGVALVGIGSATLTYAIVKSDEWGLASIRTASVFLLGVAILTLFVASQRRTDRPTLNLALFKIRNVRWVNAASFVYGIGFSASFLSSILFLTDIWDYSVLKAGLANAPGPFIVFLLASRFGKLAGRIGQRPILMTGGLLYAAAGASRWLIFGSDPNYLLGFLPVSIVVGIAVAMVLPQLGAANARALPPDQIGAGGATNQAFRQIGASFGVALTVTFLGAASSADQLVGYNRVWWLLVLAGLGTAFFSALLSSPGALSNERS